MSGEAHTARGLLADAICRMTKTLEFLDIVCNCTGFFFLLVKAFLQGEIESFSETIIQIFTFLVFAQIIIAISIKYWRFRAKNSNAKTPSSITQKYLDLVKGIYGAFEGWLDWIHFLVTLSQPTVFYPDKVNTYLFNLAPIRVYVCLRFYFIMEEFIDPRYQRVCLHQGIDSAIQSIKTAFGPNYLTLSLVGILLVEIIGFGNMIKDEEIETFSDIFYASYFIFVTISTVGYGDYVPKLLQTRILTTIILITGVFLSSMMSIGLLSATGLTQQEDQAHMILQRTYNNERKSEFQSNCLIRLLDMAKMQKELNKADMIVNSLNDYVLEDSCFLPPVRDLTQRMLQCKASFEKTIDNLTKQQRQIVKKNPQFEEVIKQYNQQMQEEVDNIAWEGEGLKGNGSERGFIDRLNRMRSQMSVFVTTNNLIGSIRPTLHSKSTKRIGQRHFHSTLRHIQ